MCKTFPLFKVNKAGTWTGGEAGGRSRGDGSIKIVPSDFDKEIMEIDFKRMKYERVLDELLGAPIRASLLLWPGTSRTRSQGTTSVFPKTYPLSCQTRMIRIKQ